ncbi:MAG: HNH endonuclease [Myxococcales bacterium]
MLKPRRANQRHADRLPALLEERSVVNALADSIEECSRLAPSGWGLTYRDDDKLLRLNLGPIEVLVVTRAGVGVFVDKSAIRTLPAGVELGNSGRYRSVPTSTLAKIPLARFEAIWPVLRDSHFALLAQAARARSGYTWKESHSQAALEFLRHANGRSLPDPGYCAREVAPPHSRRGEAGPAWMPPVSTQDERARRSQDVTVRPGQAAFREAVLQAYACRCAVTGCDAEAALEAAHITPYNGTRTDHVQNGLLLRADVHKLFDLNLITIDPRTLTLDLDRVLGGTVYEELRGKRLTEPSEVRFRPSKVALRKRREAAR